MKGIAAGFIATIILTIFMMIKKTMGVMPELDPVHMLATMAAQKLGIEENPVIGWVMHFVIGSVAWGSAIAIFNDKLPTDSQITKGIIVGIGAWFLVMIGPMPMSGSGLFGLGIGPMAPVATLILHINFGIASGVSYAKLTNSDNS